jgi:predicted nucleic-acid-binding protein
MVGLDTNVLVHYFAQDDPVQARTATEIVEERLTAQNPGLISTVVMAETVWVLDRAYRLADTAIAAVVEGMLQADVFVVESEQQVFSAMIAVRDGIATFADALIAALAARAGCSTTLTFDQRALRLAGFSAP